MTTIEQLITPHLELSDVEICDILNAPTVEIVDKIIRPVAVLLEQLKLIPPEEVKDVGIERCSPWNCAGFSGEVTSQHVADARLIIARDAQMAAVDSWWERVQTEVIRPMRAAGETVEKIAAAVGGFV